MNTLIVCGATALLALSIATAEAQDHTTLNTNRLTLEVKRPPLQLNDRQRALIQDALTTENTEQKAPAKFEPKVGETIPLSMTLDVMPERLVEREPSLEPYGYAKLADKVLVIDPMNKSIIAILARPSPTSGKDQTPANWAATRGRELTGQAPEPTTGNNNEAPEPAGDSGDKSNGNEKNANDK
jgi:hypothetical protein